MEGLGGKRLAALTRFVRCARTVATLLVVLWAVVACERGQAPRDWATRHGVDTGAPAPNREVNDPRDRIPHAEGRPGQERFWLGLTTALVGVVGIFTAIGVWLLEARRRLRRGADATARAIIDRVRREHVVSGVTIDRGRTPLWAAPIHLILRGSVASEGDRKRALDIAAAEAGRARIPPHIVDRLSVDPGARRAAG